MSNERPKNVEFISLPQKFTFFLILTLMSVAGLVGSDVYLPTLPTIATYFGKTKEALQLTISLYLLGLALGQLLLGPITDHFGRKRVLIPCMLLYMVASLACAFASNYTLLLISRFFQAVGASGGLVIGRAIIADLFDPKEAGKVFATIFPFVGMSPAISPMIGGLIGYYFGWRFNFIFIAIFAIALIILTTLVIQETLPLLKRKALHLGEVLLAYPRLLRDAGFLFYVIAPCTAYMAFFGYIAESPFIFHSEGYGERAIGSFYFSLSLTYLAGGIISRKLLSKKSLDAVLSYGFKIFSVGALLFFICGIFQSSLLWLILSISILTLGNGFLIPLGTAGVVGNFSGKVGYASGLLGFLQLGVTALVTAYIGHLTQGHVVRLGLFLVGIAILSLLARKLLSKTRQDRT
jgi:DHA1 family bicyclomycin/chloramphenicol resistance-like MFS transporter